MTLQDRIARQSLYIKDIAGDLITCAKEDEHEVIDRLYEQISELRDLQTWQRSNQLKADANSMLEALQRIEEAAA